MSHSNGTEWRLALVIASCLTVFICRCNASLSTGDNAIYGELPEDWMDNFDDIDEADVESANRRLSEELPYDPETYMTSVSDLISLLISRGNFPEQ